MDLRLLVDYLVLGLVQGVTEFLPISSDGHLVIVRHWLPTSGAGLLEIVLLHLGSLGALVWAFRRELVSVIRFQSDGSELSGLRLLTLVVLATLPVVIAGPLFASLFQQVFESMRFAAWMPLVTGFILLSTRALRPGRAPVGIATAIVMGCAQIFALLPGISRSALTISSGFATGADRNRVARFSFLMAIPAIVGANVFEILRHGGPSQVDPAGIMVGILAAFGSGLLAIRLLLKLVAPGRFEWFGAYCIAAGLFALSVA
jgi:undecaprenyl-diphosphatase